MGEGEAQPPPSPDEVLRPRNFLAYVGAAVRLYRLAPVRVIVPFVVFSAFIATLTGVAAATFETSESGAIWAAFGIQLLGVPFGCSLITARTSLVMSRGLAGEPYSVPEAGRDLRGLRSHLWACGMVATLATLMFFLAFGFLGAFLATHIFLGPVLLVHIVSVEEVSFQEAWLKMRAIMRGRALRTFLYLLCIALALVLAEVLVGQLFAQLALSITAGAGEYVVFPISGWFSGSGAVAGLGLSFMSAVGLVAYLDLRSKHDDDFEVADLRSEPEEA